MSNDRPIVVSACLLGFPCRHDGASRHDPRVLQALAGREVVPVCPETAVGLGVPREPAAFEAPNDSGAAEAAPSGPGASAPAGPQRNPGAPRVRSASGRDVSADFVRGADIAEAAVRRWRAGAAVLKERSPSCGRDCVHVCDTEGNDEVVPGRGVAAARLGAAGLRLYTEDDLP